MNESPEKATATTTIETTVDERNVEGIIASYINSGKCKNVITLAGAGISTSAGIPDFNSPITGIYENVEKYDLNKDFTRPEDLFSYDYFKKDPIPFYKFVKDYCHTFELKPTPSHYFVKLLHDKGILRRHYTQNVDGLDELAGIPSEKLVEVHGSFSGGRCLNCAKEFSREWLKNEIFKVDKPPECSYCCKAVVKPNIVFFGETIPSKALFYSADDFQNCDLLIIIGTSLTVQPFASFVDKVPESCLRLVINKELPQKFSSKNESNNKNSLVESEPPPLSSTGRRNDVMGLIGDCDDNCKKLVQKLGWNEEFEELLKK